jgi:hypothetical protein
MRAAGNGARRGRIGEEIGEDSGGREESMISGKKGIWIETRMCQGAEAGRFA